ncbi:hypothetical protein ACTFIZ_001330 [Dictyostelium cf. discoideum]
MKKKILLCTQVEFDELKEYMLTVYLNFNFNNNIINISNINPLKDLSHLFMNITYYPIREYVYFIQSLANINSEFNENNKERYCSIPPSTLNPISNAIEI